MVVIMLHLDRPRPKQNISCQCTPRRPLALPRPRPLFSRAHWSTWAATDQFPKGRYHCRNWSADHNFWFHNQAPLHSVVYWCRCPENTRAISHPGSSSDWLEGPSAIEVYLPRLYTSSKWQDHFPTVEVSLRKLKKAPEMILSQRSRIDQICAGKYY